MGPSSRTHSSLASLASFALFALWASTSLSVMSCSNDDDTTAPDGSGDTLAEGVIGAAGGEITGEGFRISVPAGAFTEDATITVTEVSVASPDPSMATRKLRLSGMPATITQPCTLAMNVNGAVDPADDFVMLIEDQSGWVTSSLEVGPCPMLRAAALEGGVFSATLPATAQGLARTGSAAAVPLSTDDQCGPLDVSVWTMPGQTTTSGGHFVITYLDQAMSPTAQAIGPILEEAYAKLRDDLGLSWAGRTRPIEVSLQTFSPDDAEKWGLHVTSKWFGVEYDVLRVNYTHASTSPSGTEMRTTIGHELFHLMQHLYDPRPQIMQGAPGEWLWIAEAMSTWFERKMAGPTFLTQGVQESDYLFLRYHGLQYSPTFGISLDCSNCWLVQNHGYGASLFLGRTFEGSTASETMLGLVLQHQAEEQTPYQALGAVLTANASSLDGAWVDFCRAFATGTVYNGVSFPTMDKVLMARTTSYTFNQPTDPGTVFSWTADNYAAQFYGVLFAPGLTFPENTVISVDLADEEGGTQVIAYECSSGGVTECGAIPESGGHLEIPDPNDWAAGEKILLLMMVRTHGSPTGQVPVLLTVRPGFDYERNYSQSIGAFLYNDQYTTDIGLEISTSNGGLRVMNVTQFGDLTIAQLAIPTPSTRLTHTYTFDLSQTNLAIRREGWDPPEGYEAVITKAEVQVVDKAGQRTLETTGPFTSFAESYDLAVGHDTAPATLELTLFTALQDQLGTLYPDGGGSSVLLVRLTRE